MQPGQKVVVVEDLVSTGNSSLKAAAAISANGGDVLGMVAIFSYEFPKAAQNFAQAGLELTTLSRYQVLIKQALTAGEITSSQLEDLMRWREDPASWGR